MITDLIFKSLNFIEDCPCKNCLVKPVCTERYDCKKAEKFDSFKENHIYMNVCIITSILIPLLMLIFLKFKYCCIFLLLSIIFTHFLRKALILRDEFNLGDWDKQAYLFYLLAPMCTFIYIEFIVTCHIYYLLNKNKVTQ